MIQLKFDIPGQTIDLELEEITIEIRRKTSDIELGQNIRFTVELNFFSEDIKTSDGNVIIKKTLSDETITLTVTSWKESTTCFKVIKLPEVTFPGDDTIKITLLSDMSGNLTMRVDKIVVLCTAGFTKTADKVLVEGKDLAPESGRADLHYTVEFGIRRKLLHFGKFYIHIKIKKVHAMLVLSN